MEPLLLVRDRTASGGFFGTLRPQTGSWSSPGKGLFMPLSTIASFGEGACTVVVDDAAGFFVDTIESLERHVRAMLSLESTCLPANVEGWRGTLGGAPPWRTVTFSVDGNTRVKRPDGSIARVSDVVPGFWCEGRLVPWCAFRTPKGGAGMKLHAEELVVHDSPG